MRHILYVTRCNLTVVLKKSDRHYTSTEIQQLFSGKQKSISNAFFRLHWLSTSDEKKKVAVIVSKKVAKSAVARNQARRRVYDVVRQLFSEWTPGLRVAILVRNPVLTAPYSELTAQLTDVCKRAGIIPSS